MKKNVSKSIQNFLQFNNTNILFTKHDGITYIAIKPICIALNIVYAGQYKSLKKDPILGPALYLCTIQPPNSQAREYTCIPEYLVYGWIFSIKSDKKELIEFKMKCYEVLFNYFHGIIGRRKELLVGLAERQMQIDQLKKELGKNESFLKLLQLEKDKRYITTEMKSIDTEVLNQTKLEFQDDILI